MPTLRVDSPSAETKSTAPRNDERTVVPFGGDPTLKRVLAPHNEGSLRLCALHVAPQGASGGGRYAREGGEAGFVLKGGVARTIGETEYQLKAGDSFRFSSTVPNAFRNTGKVVDQYVLVRPCSA